MKFLSLYAYAHIAVFLALSLCVEKAHSSTRSSWLILVAPVYSATVTYAADSILDPSSSHHHDHPKTKSVTFASINNAARNKYKLVKLQIKRKQAYSLAGAATLTISQKLIAGGCSRAIAQTLLYPMGALRTLAQTRGGPTSLANVGGLSALVRGCAGTSLFGFMIGSIQFIIYDSTKDYYGPIIASAISATSSTLISVPQDVIKQRLVTGVYDNFRNAVMTIYKTEGIKGFYYAWRPTVARNVPYVVASSFALNYIKQKTLDKKRKRYKRKRGVDTNDDYGLNIGETIVMGFSVTLMAAALTHPADVVKTRMLTQDTSDAIPYISTSDCIRTMLKNEGIQSFYSGFGQRTAYMGPRWLVQFALNRKLSTGFKRKNIQSMNWFTRYRYNHLHRPRLQLQYQGI